MNVMSVMYKEEKCTMIKFHDSQDVLRAEGWLGDEDLARIYYPCGRNDVASREIRIFKSNNESYVLKPDSNDKMVMMKIRKILEVADNA